MSFLRTLFHPFTKFFKKRKKISTRKIKKAKPARVKKLSKKIKNTRKAKRIFVKKEIKTSKPVKAIKPKAKAPAEIHIGDITHYFSKIQVVVVKMIHGKLKVGDKIHIKGKTTDFTQRVQSMQIESVDVKEAKKGQLIGLKAHKEASAGDQVFK